MSPRARERRAIRLLVVSAGAVTLLAGASLVRAAGFDGSFLKGGAPVPAASRAPEKKGPASKSTGTQSFKSQYGAAESKGVTDEDIKKNQDVIQGLTLLITNSRPGAQRNVLVLNRAAALNLYVRQMLLRGKSLKVDERGKQFLQSAIRDAQSVASSPDATADQKVRAQMIMGFGYIYLDKNVEARQVFAAVLQANPRAENAGWMALYIAEDLFDAGDFVQASRYYHDFYGQMTPQGRELASYKTAWCLINLKEETKAEQIFIKMIHVDSKEGLGKDSIRDLAFLVAHHPDPTEAIGMADKLFPTAAARVEFLGYVRASLESQNSPIFHDRIVDRILQLDTNPESRLQLMLANLRVHRKEIATHEHQTAFLKLREQLTQLKVEPGAAEFKKIEPVLDGEIQGLIRLFVETFAGRMKANEPFTHQELAAALAGQMSFYLKYFPKSPAAPQVTALWFDLCLEVKDWACVDQASEKILGDRVKYPANAIERIAVNQLAALEAIGKTPGDPGKSAASRRPDKLKAFLGEFPRSDQWLRVAKAYAQILTDRKDMDNLLPLLDQIFQREKSPDSFYRLQWARFQLGQFQLVLDDRRADPLGKPEPRLVDLRREATLALASNAKKSEDVEAYRRNIQQFLASHPDEAKAKVAREDYLRFLLKKKLYADLSRELLGLPASLRYGKELNDVLLTSWNTSLERGDTQGALNLIKDAVPATSPAAFAQDMAYRRIINSMVLGRLPTPRELESLAADRRDYLMDLLVLLHPQTVLEILQARAPRGKPVPAADREMAALALKISTGQVLLERSDRAYKLLGRDYPFASAESGLVLPIEKRIRAVKFPSEKLKGKALAKGVEKLMNDTHAIREALPKEIAGKPPEVQLRAVLAARELEDRTGKVILNSPIPKELSAEQVGQYKAGLAEAAKEFESQAAEFDKLASSVRAAMSATQSKLRSRILPQPDYAKWKWPSDFSTDAPPSGAQGGEAILRLAGQQARNHNYAGALVLADYIRGARAAALAAGTSYSSPSGFKDEHDYFRLRAGILLASETGPGNEALRFYVLSELEKNQETQVIEDWRSLVGAQLPPPGETKK